MTAALILTTSSRTIACDAPSPDALRAQLAAVTAERDALRAAVRLHRVATFEELNEAVTRAELFALVPGDCPRCGGGFCGGTASTCCRLNAEDMDAPAHNPGARVIATGGGR